MGDASAVNEPVACTLMTKQAARQVVEWQDLKALANSITDMQTTVQMVFPARLRNSIEDLAARERQCCAFLTIDVDVVDDHTVQVRIGSENPDARPILAMFAAPTG